MGRKRINDYIKLMKNIFSPSGGVSNYLGANDISQLNGEVYYIAMRSCIM